MEGKGMNGREQDVSCCECYLEHYQREVAPRLRLVDTWIKTGDRTARAEDLAAALDLDPSEVETILRKPRGMWLNRADYLLALAHGTSEVCRLYQRELDSGSPLTYTPEQIAYIYGLDQATVSAVCAAKRIREVTAYTLPLVLGEVNWRPEAGDRKPEKDPNFGSPL